MAHCWSGWISGEVASNRGLLFLAAGMAMRNEGSSSWVSLRGATPSDVRSISDYRSIANRSFPKLRNILFSLCISIKWKAMTQVLASYSRSNFDNPMG